MLKKLNRLSCNLLNSELMFHMFHMLKRQVDTIRLYLVSSIIFLAFLMCICVYIRTYIYAQKFQSLIFIKSYSFFV